MSRLRFLLSSLPLLAHSFLLTNIFPPNITWANDIATPEELVAYLSSEHRIARQNISLTNSRLVMGNNTDFSVEYCLTLFLRVDTQHYLQLYVHNDVAFKHTAKLLANFDQNRIGVLLNVVMGPNYPRKGTSSGNYVSPYTLFRWLREWPKNVRICLGIATLNGPVNQYSKGDMMELYKTAEYCQSIVHQRFVVEFEAHYLSHKFNLLDNMHRIKSDNLLLVIYAPFFSYSFDLDKLRKMIYYVGPASVYLNVPEHLRDKLAIHEQDPNKGGRTIEIGQLLTTFLTLWQIIKEILLN